METIDPIDKAQMDLLTRARDPIWTDKDLLPAISVRDPQTFDHKLL